MTSGLVRLGFLARLWFMVGSPKSIMGKLHPIITLAVSIGLVAILAASLSAYDYGGIHWDDSDLPVTWEMNENGTADCTGEFGAVRAGYQTWENVSSSYFTETYVGTSTRGLGYDGHNVVSWGDSEGEGTLAVCWTWYDGATGRIVESDIEFQDKYTWSSTGEAGKYDVQNIGTHEFGHTLLLGDLYGGGDTEKTMYGYSSAGETKKRSLHQDDIDGIRYIYPEGEPEPENSPPATPSVPTGPDSGTPGVSYSFTATTTDPDGDQVAFKFSWGDGTESGWSSFVNSGSSASMSHSWSSQGTYEVKAKAKDVNGAESGWSSSHEIVVGHPPNTPSSPSGPDAGTHGPSYSFTATTTDPDGDQVAFKFSWGDGSESGWTSLVGSGESATMSHSWGNEGTYYVKVKAKDSYDAESGWSQGHEIVIRAILLEVDPFSLDFGELGKGSSGTMTFRAYNAGSGTLSGNLSVNRDWIALSPSSFEGNDTTISVIVETGGLAESLSPHTGTITATSNGGTKTVHVLVMVIPSGAAVHPNPFSPTSHTSLTFWGTSVPYARIQIFTTAGNLVRTLVETAGASKLLWDGKNEEGDRVARGIYIYVAKDSRGKIAVL